MEDTVEQSPLGHKVKETPLTPEQREKAAQIYRTRAELDDHLDRRTYTVEDREEWKQRADALFPRYEGLTGVTRDEVLAQREARYNMDYYDRERMVYGRMGSTINFYRSQRRYLQEYERWGSLLRVEQSKIEQAIRGTTPTSSPQS